MAPELIPTDFPGFWGTYSRCMDTLLSVDIVGRTLDLPQNNMPYPFCGVDGGSGISGESGQSGGRGNLDWHV